MILRLLFRLLKWALAVGLLAFGVMLGLLCLWESRIPKDPAGDYDAIVVLGAQVYPSGDPSPQLALRLEAAKRAWDRRNVPVVVCGAKGVNEPEAEALVMKAALASQGIPEQGILTDAESFNTRENLLNAGKLLAPLPGVRRLLVVTSDYHAPRALALARDAGWTAEALGSPCKPEFWLKNHFRETLAWFKYLAVKYLRLPLNP